MARFAMLVAGAALVVGPAFAGERDCRSDHLNAEVFLQVAVVRNEGRPLNFVKNGETDPVCPSAVDACREPAYLVPGNGVIVGAEVDGFRCAIYIATNGQSRAGWLPSSGLLMQPPVNRPDWSGRWTAGPEQTITIRRGTEATWQIDGDATYGARDPERVKRGGVNMGNFSVQVNAEDVRNGTFMAFAEGENGALPYDQGPPGLCRIKLRLVGPWMVVGDNGSCGGHNVSFSGIYQRGR